MNPIRLSWFLVAVLLSPLAWAEDVDKRLEAGEVVVTMRAKGKVKEVRASALFSSAPEKIWDLIYDCNRFTKTMLRIKEAKELSREGKTIRCRTVLEMPWPLENLTAVTDAVNTVSPGKKWQRKWKGVEGDFVVNEGSWTITPYTDGKSMLVVYQARVQPKVDVPDELREMAQRRELPKLLRHLKSQLGEEG